MDDELYFEEYEEQESRDIIEEALQAANPGSLVLQ